MTSSVSAVGCMPLLGGTLISTTLHQNDLASLCNLQNNINRPFRFVVRVVNSMFASNKRTFLNFFIPSQCTLSISKSIISIPDAQSQLVIACDNQCSNQVTMLG